MSKTILHFENRDYIARKILFYLYTGILLYLFMHGKKSLFFRYTLGSLRYNRVNACT